MSERAEDFGGEDLDPPTNGHAAKAVDDPIDYFPEAFWYRDEVPPTKEARVEAMHAEIAAQRALETLRPGIMNSDALRRLGISKGIVRDPSRPSRLAREWTAADLARLFAEDAKLEVNASDVDASAARDRENANEGPPVSVQLLRELAGEILDQSKVPTLDWGIAGLNKCAPLPVRAAATIFGPTGAGKTSLATTIAAHRARYRGSPSASQGPTVYMQLELTPAQLAARRASQVTPYSWRQILGGALSPREIASALDGEQFYVVKVARRSYFIDQAKRALDLVGKLSPGTPLLVVDYLQRIKAAGRDVRDSMTNVVDDLIDLVESRDMFALVLSKGSRHGSRAMRDGKTRGEALVDAAAETSAIEAGSAVAIAITYDNRDGQDATDARLEIVKARYGVTGAAVGMRFHGASGRWDELADVPLPKGEREATDHVVEAVRGNLIGFESRTELYKAVGGNKQNVMKAIARELTPGGRLELKDGRIVYRKGEPS